MNLIICLLVVVLFFMGAYIYYHLPQTRFKKLFGVPPLGPCEVGGKIERVLRKRLSRLKDIKKEFRAFRQSVPIDHDDLSPASFEISEEAAAVGLEEKEQEFLEAVFLANHFLVINEKALVCYMKAAFEEE